MTENISSSIRNFIDEQFPFRQASEGIEDTDSLIESGVIDSAGILSLVLFLEETFSIQVADDEVVPDNLETISNLTAYVCRKLEREGGDRTCPTLEKSA